MSKKLAISLLAILLLGAVALAHAQNIPIQPTQIDLNRNAGAGEIRHSPQANARLTEQQAIALARQQFAGKLLRISLVGEGKNQRYQIRMENEGRVFTVFVNVTTGRVSGGG